MTGAGQRKQGGGRGRREGRRGRGREGEGREEKRRGGESRPTVISKSRRMCIAARNSLPTPPSVTTCFPDTVPSSADDGTMTVIDPVVSTLMY